VGGLMLESDLS